MSATERTTLYLIDTNIIIQADKDYPPAVFPQVWDFLTQNIQDGASDSIRILLLRCVFEEIQKKTDRLQEWSLAFESCCVNEATDEQFVSSLSFVTNGTAESFRRSGCFEKKQSSFGDFCRNADIQLVAYAKAHDCKIITNEKRNDDDENSKKVKIPNVGEIFGIECLNLIEMFQKEKICFK